MKKDDRTTSEWLFDGGLRFFQATVACGIACILACIMLAFFKEGGVSDFFRVIRSITFWAGVVAFTLFAVIDCIGFVFRCGRD